jgi:chitin synthase
MLLQSTVNVFTLCRGHEEAQPEYEAFAARWHSPLRRTSILTCLTVYNEPGIELVRSLAGLARNVEDLHAHTTDVEASDFTVCVIADGQDRLHPTTRYWAARLGLLPEDYERILISGDRQQSPDSFTLFEAELSTTRIAAIAAELTDTLNLPQFKLLRQQDIQPLKGGSYPTKRVGDCVFRVLFCLKAQNAGKLDSHWWFFNRLCPVIRPEYCIQMDVGTVPANQTVRHLWETLEQDSTCAAASACILSSPPSKPWKFLQAWQYATFVWDKTIDWPVQTLCGYLEVVPGQFCILRWQALSSDKEPNERTKDSPLNYYFRGLQALSPLESNLFLAEDRVLGFELISQPQADWTIRYVPDAVAVTDECKSLSELLRQRRRWINSGSIAKLWAFLHIGRYWRDSNSCLMRKLGILISMSWSMMLLVMEWFLPSLVFTPLLILGLSNSEMFGDHPVLVQAVQSAAVAFSLLWLVQVLLCMKQQLDSKGVVFWLRLTLLLQTFITLLLIGAELAKQSIFWVPFLALTVGLPLITASKLSSSVFRQVLPLAMGHVLIGVVMNLLLTTYAITNLHDCSWGTKGLHPENQAVGKRSLPRHSLTAYRDRAFIVFLLTGVVIFGLVLLGQLSILHLLVVLCCVFIISLVLRLFAASHTASRKKQFLVFRNNAVTAWLLINGSFILALSRLEPKLLLQVGLVICCIYTTKIAFGAVCGLFLLARKRVVLNKS